MNKTTAVKKEYVCPYRIAMGIWSAQESKKWLEQRRIEFAKIESDPNYMPK
jgi:hypothetical protein